MIRVAVDDLAFLPVDAVVRPADDVLDPVTPGASRLDQLAGGEFVRQRRVQVPLGAGAAVVTAAGELPAKFVLHVVIRSPERATGADTVRRALTSAWQRAADWGLRTVAAPLVGTGPGALETETAASLLVETFLQRPADSLELCIVVETENDRRLVEAVIARSGN